LNASNRQAIQRPLVIVPTYNEVENIGQLLACIQKDAPQFDVLVVDDNSPDGTAGIVRSQQLQDPRVHLLSRPKKDGLAAAYGAGFQWGIDNGYDMLVEMDADFSHEPRMLPVFLETMKQSDIVVGSRYVPGGKIVGWNWIRQCISRGGNIYARMVLGMPYLELTGGFNAWRTHVLKEIDGMHLRSKGYAFQVELKYRAHRKGFQFKEIPITFENRRFGKSKMSGNIVWEAALRVLQMREGGTPLLCRSH
jgi:dolichol-phosphate mannosyltransferase